MKYMQVLIQMILFYPPLQYKILWPQEKLDKQYWNEVASGTKIQHRYNKKRFSYQHIYRRTSTQIILHCLNIKRKNHYQTHKEISCIIYDRRFGINELVHEDINAEKGVLLWLPSYGCCRVLLCLIGFRV